MHSAIRKMVGMVKVKKIQLYIDDEWVICDNARTIQKQATTIPKISSEPKFNSNQDIQNQIVQHQMPIRLVSSALSINTLSSIDINLEEPKGDIENGIVYDLYTAIAEVIENSEILSLFHFLNNMSVAINGL